MPKKRVLLITGSSGYLSQLVIDRILEKRLFSRVVGLDVKEPDKNWKHRHSKHFTFFYCDVRNRKHLAEIFSTEKPHTVLHLAWVFNPSHDRKMEHDVDVFGTQNVFEEALLNNVKKIVYVGSTTAYWNKNNPIHPPFLREDHPVSGSRLYLYSKYKAEIDRYIQKIIVTNRDLTFTRFRAPIIIGKHTKNIVTQISDWKMPGFKDKMFMVDSLDPPFQFLSENDFVEILYRAIAQNHPGTFNMSADGTMKYSEIISALGRKPMKLPKWLIYPTTWLLWKLRICPFPAGVLDLISRPWVSDISRLKHKFGYVPKKTSQEAFDEFVASRQ